MFKRHSDPVRGTGHQGPRHHGYGERAEKWGRIGWECWSKRDYIAGTWSWPVGSGTGRKLITHKKERRIADREVRKLLKEFEEE